MWSFDYTVLGLVGRFWDPVHWFNHTGWVAVVIPTDRPKSVRNRCVIEVFGGVFVLSRCFFYRISAGIEDFVIRLIQISSVFVEAKIVQII